MAVIVSMTQTESDHGGVKPLKIRVAKSSQFQPSPLSLQNEITYTFKNPESLQTSAVT
jgi:hypothetical protein